MRLNPRDHSTAIPFQSDGQNGSYIGRRFLDHLVRGDREALLRLMAPEVRFRAVAPGRHWESHDPIEIVDDILLGDFFGPDVVIEKLHSAGFGAVADINSASYFVQMRHGHQRQKCQQHLFMDVRAGVVRSIHLSCTGFVEISDED